MVLHGDGMEGKNKKEILGFLHEDLQHIETVSEVSQRKSNFERLKTDYSRSGNMGPPKDKTVNGLAQDEHNGANMGEKEAGPPKNFNGSSITLTTISQMVEKKNTEVKMAKYESRPTVATQIETKIHGGKRSHDACVDGDTMDVDSAKRPKDLKDFSPTIIFLMETRVCDSEARGLKLILQQYNMLVVSSVGRSVKEDSNTIWRGTGIYGWPKQQDKHQTWNLLRFLRRHQIQAWLCFGDFNEILYAYEKMGRRGCNVSEMTSFLDACNFCNLEDMSACGVKYTWSNGR
ncbi:reverse transcriptase [Tanacetum coccineum]